MKDHPVILKQVLQFLRQQPPDHGLQETLAFLVQLTGWAGAALLTPDVKKSTLYVEAAAGLLSSILGSTLPASFTLTDVALHSKDIVCLSGSSGDGFLGLELGDGAWVLVIPLKRGEHVHRLLTIVGDRSDICSEEAHVLAESLAYALDLALQNVRLYTTLQHEVNERQMIEDRFWASIQKTETLYHVSRSLLRPQELDAVLPAVLSSIAGALRADQVLLLRCIDDEPQSCEVLVGGTAHSSSAIPSATVLTSGMLGEIIRQGLPVSLSQAYIQSRGWQFDGSIAIAPLFASEQMSGALIAMNRPDQRDFVQPDVDLLMATATQLATAMQNAQLFLAVSEERERLQAVVGSSRDGVLLLGLDLRILVVNKLALRLLGVLGDPKQWVNRSAWEILRDVREHSPHVLKIAFEEMRRVRSGQELSHEGETKVGLRIVHWLSLPVRSLGQSSGRLLLLRDVTDARLLEQFREDLTHTMVHDLRNPLTGIYAALNLLTRGVGDVLSPGQKQILQIAHLSTQRMLKLVNAILEISRLETGQVPLNPSAFQLSDIVKELITLEKPLIEERQLHLINAVDIDVPPVWADKDLVERVMQNLLSNALKFTPNGGRVSVIAGVEPETPNRLQISVIDSGPGIPPEIRRNLFTKFVAGSQEEHGNGLGLAFCRMAIEAHGERIWVSNTSDSGTTFTFTLPLASITVV